ncbi:MAG: hypothetical protein ACRDBP_19195 [Luteolibacter sp.]
MSEHPQAQVGSHKTLSDYFQALSVISQAVSEAAQVLSGNSQALSTTGPPLSEAFLRASMDSQVLSAAAASAVYSFSSTYKSSQGM